MVVDSDSWDEPTGAEVYDEAVRAGTIHRALVSRLVERLGESAAGRVLDVGCGSGVAAEVVHARHPEACIAGIDRARAMLRLARRSVPIDRAAFLLGAPERLPFAARTFDAILSSAAFWHFPRWREALDEAGRVATESGRLALNVPAAQLWDAEDAPPTPIQRTLAAEGERLFGRAPSPASAGLGRAEIVSAAASAGWRLEDDTLFDLGATQGELASLLYVPAIGGRLYPEVDREALVTWIAGALERIDVEERVVVRWWDAAFVR